ncbi:MAG: GHMP kinase [Lachnospiraceae bacterium]|nr:GHMP kinase [Lachnospiraceae bacterium]
MKIFTPYRVCPLGAHVDHQLGVVTGFAIDKGVTLEFEPTEDGSIYVVSKNFPGEVAFHVSDEPEREMNWGDFIRGAVIMLSQKYTLTRGISGVIEGTLPIGGLSSSAAVILTYLNALCKVNDIHLTPQGIIDLAIRVERGYIGVNVGKLDQSCEVYCKEGCLLVLDTLDDSGRNIPVNKDMPPFEIMIMFSGVERSLAGSAYNARVDECKSAAYAIKALSGMEYGKYADTYLRDIPEGVYEAYKDKIPESFGKRAKHYFSEQQRVRKGVEAWKKGDIVTFGQMMFASGRSSIENYEAGSKQLTKLQNIIENVDGIYGGRFSGAGFNGCSMAIIDPAKREQIIELVTEKYLEAFPELTGKFSIHICKTANGVEL